MMKSRTFTVVRRVFSTNNSLVRPKVCVVGAGPAGFYAAQHLAKKLKECEIDILEKLPVPFGLVRFGVAPDHPEVKNVINTFTRTAENPKVKFYGNIALGRDISLEQLRDFYHVVILTYGAEENRQLGIPGEDLTNVIPARKIVGWYNGVPGDENLTIDLSAETVAIIGQGNVAIDVARILLSPVDELKKTDITQYALDQISQSKIKKILLFGRRGPLQAAFTIKELREMLRLPNCTTIWKKNDFDSVQYNLEKLPRPKKRITELMLKSVQECRDPNGNCKVFNPVFLRSPIEILGQNKVEKLVLGVNELKGDDLLQKTANLTDMREVVDCQLVISSIGYRSIQVDPSIPFKRSKGIVDNENGKISTGLYTSGWLSTGPMGVILTTMSNAFTVADKIVQDIKTFDLIKEDKPGWDEVKKNVKRQVVTWQDWQKIDKFEVDEGKKVGKPREKVVDVERMLEIARS